MGRASWGSEDVVLPEESPARGLVASRKDVGYCCFKQEITVSTLLVHLLYAWLCARASMGAVMKSLQQAQGRRTYHPHFTDKEHVTQAQG